MDANTVMAKALFKAAMNGSVTAMIFWLSAAPAGAR